MRRAVSPKPAAQALARRSRWTLGATNAPMRYFIAALFLPLLLGCPDRGGYMLAAKQIAAASAASAVAADGRDLILPLEVDPQTAETFVRIGFGLNRSQRFQSTEFLTPRLRTRQAVPLIRLVKRYNEFNGESVATAIDKLHGQVSGVEFGREGSPVLYIELPYWTHQREEAAPNGLGTKIPEMENDALVAQLRRVFVGELKAEEFSVSRRRVRIWWN